MSVHVDHYPTFLEHYPTSWAGAAIKARPVYNLVQANIDLLRDAKPKTVERNRDYPRAVHNMHRLTHEDPDFHPYMIRERTKRGALIGLASVATNQAIWHPGLERTFEGTEVSYWLVKGRRYAEHLSVAEALIEQSGALALKSMERLPVPELPQGEEPHTEDLELSTADLIVMNQVFATVPTAHTELSPGFGYQNTLPAYRNTLLAAGDPAKFSLSPDRTGPDPLEIAQGGQVSQLYYGEFPLPVPR